MSYGWVVSSVWNECSTYILKAQEPQFSGFHPHSMKHFNITCITPYLPGRSRSAIWAALASSILIPSLAPGARSATVPDTLLAAESICADIMFTCTHNTSVLMYDLQGVYTLLERQQNYSNDSVSDVLQINIYIHPIFTVTATGVFNRHISTVWKANTMPFTWSSTVPLFMITKDQNKPSESPNPFSVHLETDQITKTTYRGNICVSPNNQMSIQSMSGAHIRCHSIIDNLRVLRVSM